MIHRLSPSQLSTFTKCQLQWYYRYVEGWKRPPGVAAYLGKGVDGSVTANLEAKMAGAALSLDEAKELARDGVAKAWDEEPPAEGDMGEVQDNAVTLAGLHHQSIAPQIEPIEVQAKRTCEPEGHDFTLLMYLDVLEADKIRDTKTKGKKPPADIADRGDNANQLTSYWMAEKKAVQLDMLINVKKPYHLLIEGNERTELDAAKLLDRYDRMTMALDAGVFQPAPADSWQCSAKWCGYFDICPHGDRNVAVVPLSNLTRKVDNAPSQETANEDDFDVAW